MRKILLFIIVLVSVHSKAQKFEGLPIVNGKVTYDFTFKKDTANFSRISKLSIANYVRYYNGSVNKLENKINDYIVYEDSNEIDANLIFTGDALMSPNLFTASVKLTKTQEGIKVLITDFVRTKFGDHVMPVKIEDLKWRPDKPVFKALDQQVKILLKNIYDLN